MDVNLFRYYMLVFIFVYIRTFLVHETYIFFNVYKCRNVARVRTKGERRETIAITIPLSTSDIIFAYSDRSLLRLAFDPFANVYAFSFY